MDNLEKLETVAEYVNFIGNIYDGMLDLVERVNTFCADEENGSLDRNFARDMLWTRLQKLKNKAQDTPPPFPPQLDNYGLSPIPRGHEEETAVMPDESGEDKMRDFCKIAYESWMQLACDLRQMEGDLFGGKEVWITGESNYSSLLGLEAAYSAHLEIFHRRQRGLVAWYAKMHKLIADAAHQQTAAAEMARIKAEGAREAEAVARERAERRGMQDIVEAIEADGEKTRQTVRESENALRNDVVEKKRERYRIETLIEAFNLLAKKESANKYGFDVGQLIDQTLSEIRESGRELKLKKWSFRAKYNIWGKMGRPQTAKDYLAAQSDFLKAQKKTQQRKTSKAKRGK